MKKREFELFIKKVEYKNYICNHIIEYMNINLYYLDIHYFTFLLEECNEIEKIKHILDYYSIKYQDLKSESYIRIFYKDLSALNKMKIRDIIFYVLDIIEKNNLYLNSNDLFIDYDNYYKDYCLKQKTIIA